MSRRRLFSVTPKLKSFLPRNCIISAQNTPVTFFYSFRPSYQISAPKPHPIFSDPKKSLLRKNFILRFTYKIFSSFQKIQNFNIELKLKSIWLKAYRPFKSPVRALFVHKPDSDHTPVLSISSFNFQNFNLY